MAKREMKTVIGEQPDVINEQTEAVEQKTAEEKPVLKYKINGCSKLRIRRKPDVNSDVICLVDESNELTVKEIEGNRDWVRVTTDSGKKGFCMKKFITIK